MQSGTVEKLKHLTSENVCELLKGSPALVDFAPTFKEEDIDGEQLAQIYDLYRRDDLQFLTQLGIKTLKTRLAFITLVSGLLGEDNKNQNYAIETVTTSQFGNEKAIMNIYNEMVETEEYDRYIEFSTYSLNPGLDLVAQKLPLRLKLTPTRIRELTDLRDKYKDLQGKLKKETDNEKSEQLSKELKQVLNDLEEKEIPTNHYFPVIIDRLQVRNTGGTDEKDWLKWEEEIKKLSQHPLIKDYKNKRVTLAGIVDEPIFFCAGRYLSELRNTAVVNQYWNNPKENKKLPDPENENETGSRKFQLWHIETVFGVGVSSPNPIFTVSLPRCLTAKSVLLYFSCSQAISPPFPKESDPSKPFSLPEDSTLFDCVATLIIKEARILQTKEFRQISQEIEKFLSDAHRAYPEASFSLALSLFTGPHSFELGRLWKDKIYGTPQTMWYWSRNKKGLLKLPDGFCHNVDQSIILKKGKNE